jgi:hypothetical protein
MSRTREPCVIEGCERLAAARTLCRLHYDRAKKAAALPPLRTMTRRGYIESKIQRNKSNACWEWTDHLKRGYGSASWNGERTGAHRFSYETFVGPIPDGLHIDHLCRNRRCVNPEHLEPVTLGENSRRGVLYPSITGIRGCGRHGQIDGFIGESNNRGRGKRTRAWRCRICQRERSRKSKAKRRALRQAAA